MCFTVQHVLLQFFVCAAFVTEYVVLYLKINTYSLVQPFQKISAERQQYAKALTTYNNNNTLIYHTTRILSDVVAALFSSQNICYIAAIENKISYFTYNCHLTFIIFTCLYLLVFNLHCNKKVVLSRLYFIRIICGRKLILKI